MMSRSMHGMIAATQRLKHVSARSFLDGTAQHPSSAVGNSRRAKAVDIEQASPCKTFGQGWRLSSPLCRKMDEKPVALSRFLRYPICTIVSFCLVLGLCLECFLTTTTVGTVEHPPEQAASTLPPADATALIDLQDFRFLMNNLACADTAPLVLVLVLTSPAKRANRDAIRETWGLEAKTSPKYKVLFLLGQPDSPDRQASLEEENAEHHDLVQGSFGDVTQNATYKHVMALKWAVYHCPKTRVVFRVDDETFLNTRTILEFFSHDLPAFWTKRLILCNISPNLTVERNSSSKRYVPVDVYPAQTFPPHCQSEAIAYSSDMALALYQAAQKSTYFHLDDVHVTGTLAQSVNASLVPFGPLALGPEDPSTGDKEWKPMLWPFWVGPMGMSPEYVYQFWNNTQNRGDNGRPLAYMHMGLCPYP